LLSLQLAKLHVQLVELELTRIFLELSAVKLCLQATMELQKDLWLFHVPKELMLMLQEQDVMLVLLDHLVELENLLPLQLMLNVLWATTALWILELWFKDHAVEESTELLKELQLKEQDVQTVTLATTALVALQALSHAQQEHTVQEVKLYPTSALMEPTTSSSLSQLLEIA
jgi:hypothetical protein